ncbi:MAG: hypothetical protein Q4G33_08905 [bacterium]|nr:hypothetical protein [bacterium]
MMKTLFSAPSIEIKQFSRESVIALSGGTTNVDGTDLAATALAGKLGITADSVQKMRIQ